MQQMTSTGLLLSAVVTLTLCLPTWWETNLREITLLKIQVAIVLLSTGLYTWQTWREAVPVSQEPEVLQKYGQLIGEPRLDPVAGIVATAIVNGKTVEILIQPKWWEYLGDSKIIKSQQETTVVSSPVSSVPKGKEPGSLVCLQRLDGVVVGMASRAKIGSRTVLLTNFHVLKKHSELFICKNGQRVKVEQSWPAEAWCGDVSVDFVALRVPDKVWSKLGVSSSAVRPLVGCQAVTCYGAHSSEKFLASTGLAMLAKGLTARHSCSTVTGWSGSPLYSKGSIVALHRGFHELGVSNNATLINTLLTTEETTFAEGEIKEIDEAEGEFRSGFTDYEVGGRGTYAVGDSEYYVKHYEEYKPLNGGRLWADIAEEEDFDFFDTMETLVDQPLNGPQAVSECSPPSVNLESTSGKSRSVSLQTECPSLSLEDRVCVLEKLAEQTIQSSLKLHELCSQNFKTLVGLNAELERKLIRSSSKQADIVQHPDLKASRSVQTGSAPVIQGLSPGENLEAKIGRNAKSRRRRKSSVTKPSTGNPPPESLSQQ